MMPNRKRAPEEITSCPRLCGASQDIWPKISVQHHVNCALLAVAGKAALRRGRCMDSFTSLSRSTWKFLCAISLVTLLSVENCDGFTGSAVFIVRVTPVNKGPCAKSSG